MKQRDDEGRAGVQLKKCPGQHPLADIHLKRFLVLEEAGGKLWEGISLYFCRITSAAFACIAMNSAPELISSLPLL